jgi:hypothetical protein
MKVKLYKRHHGVHSFVKEKNIEGTLKKYAKVISNDSNRVGDFYKINETKLIDALPKNFFPENVNRILVTVENETGSTGQDGLTKFRNYAKYFDCYVLELSN